MEVRSLNAIFMLSNNKKQKKMKALTIEQMIEQCPPIAQTHPSRKVSDKYIQIPTLQVVKDAMQFGWVPTSAHMRGNGTSNFCKHGVTMMYPDAESSLGGSADLIIPKIEIVNSHDGLSTFRFYAGIFRKVCSNGMIIPFRVEGKSTSKYLRIRHINYNLDELQATLKEVAQHLVESVKGIYKLMDEDMTQAQMEQFAKRAFIRRSTYKAYDPVEMVKTSLIETPIIETLLKAERELDQPSTAWAVFNRVQEKIVNGFSVTLEKKEKRYQGLTGFERDISVNSGMFEDLLATMAA